MTITKQKQINCCICNGLIPLEGTQESIDNGTAWANGNNASPVVEGGSCCDKCNAEVVMAARFGSNRERYIRFLQLERTVLEDMLAERDFHIQVCLEGKPHE